MNVTPVEKLFALHGIKLWDTGGQLVGDCPFCGADDKLYANPETGQYECKVCHTAGNPPLLLKQLVEFRTKDFTPPGNKEYQAFARSVRSHRAKKAGFPASVFPTSPALARVFSRAHFTHCAFREGHWQLPIYAPIANADKVFPASPGKRVANLKIYGPDSSSPRFLSTPKVDPRAKLQQPWTNDAYWQEERPIHVWITEGEWDGLLLDYILNGAARRECVDHWVLALPGGSWKLDLPAMARVVQVSSAHKIPVTVILDNDAASSPIAKKLTKALASAGCPLSPFEWPDKTPEKYDLSDAVLNPESPFREDLGGATKPGAQVKIAFTNLIGPELKRPAELPSSQEEARVSLEPMKFREVVSRFEELGVTMHRSMQNALWLAGVASVSSQFSGIPLWQFIVSPPGSGKSLILESLAAFPTNYFQTGLTHRALMSGFNAGEGDPSILRDLTDPARTLVLKDYTTVTELEPNDRKRLGALLREAFDGKIDQKYANGSHRVYEGRFGFIAGVTPRIDEVNDADVGARFLKWRMRHTVNDNAKLLHELLTGGGSELESPDNLAERCLAVNRWLAHTMPQEEPETAFEGDDLAAIKALTFWVIYGRAVVRRDRFEGVPTTEPSTESPNRVAKQLARLWSYLRVLRPQAKPHASLRLLVEVAASTGWSPKSDLLKRLLDSKQITTRRFVSVSGLPKQTARRHLDDLHVLGITEQTSKKTGSVGRDDTAHQLCDWFEPHAEVLRELFA